MATKISNATSEKTQRRNSSPFQNSRNQIRKKMPISRHGNGNKSSGPNLLKNNKQKRNKTPREKVRLQERVGNRGSNVNNIRRMDSAPTNIEYVDTAGGDTATEMDFFDAKTRKLWNQCKNKASQKERKIDDTSSKLGLPVFEHFPIRKLKKDLDNNSQKSFDLQCRELVQKFVKNKSLAQITGNQKAISATRDSISIDLMAPRERSSAPTSPKATPQKSSTILNDELRKQILLQDMYINDPER